MNDEQIQQQIEALEAERLRLREREGAGDPKLDEDRVRLEAIGVELDRLWDLQRQRRALRDAGSDPDQAVERPASTVERYLQ